MAWMNSVSFDIQVKVRFTYGFFATVIILYRILYVISYQSRKVGYGDLTNSLLNCEVQT
jgi:hypothetical protein